MVSEFSLEARKESTHLHQSWIPAGPQFQRIFLATAEGGGVLQEGMERG